MGQTTTLRNCYVARKGGNAKEDRRFITGRRQFVADVTRSLG